MDKYLAHIRKDGDLQINQTVKDHCKQTAKYASENLKQIGLYNTGMIVGLLHDCGKFKNSFNEYLINSVNDNQNADVRRKIDHSSIGAIYILDKYHGESASKQEKIASEIIAYAIAAHHGSMDCMDSNGQNGFLRRLANKEVINYDEAIGNFFNEMNITREDIDALFEESAKEISKHLEMIDNCISFYPQIVDNSSLIKKSQNRKFHIAMLVRMITSALIDADRTDTYLFMSDKPKRQFTDNSGIWKKQLDFLENKISKFDNSSDINKARSYMSDACFNFQNSGNGIIRLDLPTGAGKTLSSLRFALKNADKYKKQRIFFIVPLLSVLDQNSKVIKENIHDSSIITEHHSNVIIDKNNEEELEKYEILSSTWDSPIIVSTMVQFLNTLFSHKNSCIRRMRSLANSVIVIDEVQSVPKKIMYMFNSAINYLAYCCNAMVVLSSATQPAFDAVNVPMVFLKNADMVPYDKNVWEAFKRTQTVNKTKNGAMDIDELSDFVMQIIENEKSLLVICNTKASAAELFKKLKQDCSDENVKLYHLSNAMCYSHRIEKLEFMRKDLKYINGTEDSTKVICVSTQVIEAGVDISFSSVIRVLAGLDSIAQAAGRCNRNHESDIGNVYIVELKKDIENVKMLPDIIWSQDACKKFFLDFEADPEKYDNDMLSNKSIRRYYEGLFEIDELKNSFLYNINQEGRSKGQPNNLYSMLSNNKVYSSMNKKEASYSMLKQAFKSAGENFKVFKNDTTDVIVPYNEDAKRIIAGLYDASVNSYHIDYDRIKELIEDAKSYTVQIFEGYKNRLTEQGLLEVGADGLFQILISGYDDDLGITYMPNAKEFFF